jgi:hypothetical protein
MVNIIQPVHYSNLITDEFGISYHYGGEDFEKSGRLKDRLLHLGNDSVWDKSLTGEIPDEYVDLNSIILMRIGEQIVDGKYKVVISNGAELLFKVVQGGVGRAIALINGRFYVYSSRKFKEIEDETGNEWSGNIRLVRDEFIIDNDGNLFDIVKNRDGNIEIVRLNNPFQVVDVIRDEPPTSTVLALDKNRGLWMLLNNNKWKNLSTPLIDMVGVYSFATICDEAVEDVHPPIHIVGLDGNLYRMKISISRGNLTTQLIDSHIVDKLFGVQYPRKNLKSARKVN